MTDDGAVSDLARTSTLRVNIAVLNPAFITSALPASKITIGDFTALEQNVHIVCRLRVDIGRFEPMTGNRAIVDVHHLFDDVEYPRRAGSHIVMVDHAIAIGDYTFVGMNSIILPGASIGHHFVIGACSIVAREIPDYCVAVGHPARVAERYDTVNKMWKPYGANVHAGAADKS